MCEKIKLSTYPKVVPPEYIALYESDLNYPAFVYNAVVKSFIIAM